MDHESTPGLAHEEYAEDRVSAAVESTPAEAAEGTPAEEAADAVTWRAEPERVSE